LSGITHAHQDRCNPRCDPTSLTEIAPLYESLMRANQRVQAFALFANQIRRHGQLEQLRRFER